MTNVKNIDQANNSQFNARVVDHYKEMNLEPLRPLFDKMGPVDVVNDLEELTSLLNSLIYQPFKPKWSREYIQDRMYAVNTLRRHFLELERSMVQKGGQSCQ